MAMACVGPVWPSCAEWCKERSEGINHPARKTISCTKRRPELDIVEHVVLLAFSSSVSK